MKGDSLVAPVGVTLAAWLLVATIDLSAAEGQTLQATHAIDQRECDSFLFGLGTSCTTIRTRRVTANFASDKLNRRLFGGTWSGVAHCIFVEHPSQKCERSVAVVSDPVWGRLMWGHPNQGLKAVGKAGSGTS